MTTADSNFPSPARDLVRIHKAITRGLKVAVEKGAGFQQHGFPDPALRQGFSDYAQALGSVLDAHHLAEDEVAFPRFQQKLPQAPFDRLSTVHKEIAILLGPIRQAVPEIAASGDGAALIRLLEALSKITGLWAPHIRMEESIFSFEALSEVMTPEEQAGLSGEMGKYSSEHSTPPFLTVPFVLFNLQPDDRNVMLATLPPTFMDDLVMKAWKDQWAPMKPFLLD